LYVPAPVTVPEPVPALFTVRVWVLIEQVLDISYHPPNEQDGAAPLSLRCVIDPEYPVEQLTVRVSYDGVGQETE